MEDMMRMKGVTGQRRGKKRGKRRGGERRRIRREENE